MPTDNPANSRKWEREPATIQVELILKNDKFKVGHSATTLDVSLQGVGVRTTVALIPGEWVGVVPKGEFPQAIPARVVWSRDEEPSHWTLAGLEFLVTPEV